jgi:diguanylate cyclase (GGDEF)-like protein
MDRLRQAVAIRERVNTFGALLWIDLDNFNLLNDAYGHDKGDLILKKIAQRLQSLVRVGDTVARLGGDEFVILFLGFDSSESEVINNIEILAEKLLASLREGVSLDGHSYQTQASAGATVFCGSSVAADELMKQAELALYNAKDAGRNTCRFFDPRMQAAVNKRIGVEAALRSAIHERQFVLHYQPQVDDEGVIVGAEALIRWLHPDRGMVPPAEFIPVAEDSGLIVSIGHWVLETACEQLSLWARQPGFSRLTLAVNVSAQQARLPGFVAEVSALIGRIEGAGKRLKLELTESLLLDNHEEIVGKMTALKKVGAMFSLDDFGTGYSSLSYLKSLPLDQLKIDKSFVNDVVSSASDAAIAQTIVSLANSLGLSVIAEGVETQAQRDRLLEIGCSNYQGYFFSKPLPLADFEKLVLSTRVASIAASGPRAVSTPVVKLSAA